jgi:hypothetical protein
MAGAALLLAILSMPRAWADGDPDLDGGTSGSSLWIRGNEQGDPPGGPRGEISQTAEHTLSTEPEIVLGELCTLGNPFSVASALPLELAFCPEPKREDAEPVALTIGHIRSAFARLPLPASELVIQPPDGLTLVNFDTNFYTPSTEPITKRVRLLGRAVTIEATPSEYHWTFGDGSSLVTTDPGAPYPALTVTHNYLQKDTYAPALDTVYTGRFRVGDGPGRTIPGTVTIDGAPQRLRAIEAQPKLVSYTR